MGTDEGRERVRVDDRLAEGKCRKRYHVARYGRNGLMMRAEGGVEECGARTGLAIVYCTTSCGPTVAIRVDLIEASAARPSLLSARIPGVQHPAQRLVAYRWHNLNLTFMYQHMHTSSRTRRRQPEFTERVPATPRCTEASTLRACASVPYSAGSAAPQ